MNVKLTQHAAELLEAVRSRSQEPIERILEHALEVLANTPDIAQAARTSVLELQGLGKEIWEGVDAQQYVDHERAEWNG